MKTYFTTMNEAIDHFLADGYALIKAGECFNGMEFVVLKNFKTETRIRIEQTSSLSVEASLA